MWSPLCFILGHRKKFWQAYHTGYKYGSEVFLEKCERGKCSYFRSAKRRVHNGYALRMRAEQEVK